MWFDFDDVQFFTTGTVGRPGARTFFLQASNGERVVTLQLEKQQVDALADYLERVAERFGIRSTTPTPMPELSEPVEPEWIVGSIMVAVDSDEQRIIVIAEELLLDDENDPDSPVASQARFSLTADQAAGFVIGAREVVSAGRPICRLCGRPIDPSGHFCPRMN